jgi:hypothetical protein
MFELSTRKNKKYMTTYKGKIIHFGDKRYQQYFDKIGHYSHLNHLDEERRKNYLSRAKGIKKNGRLSYKDKTSPNYYSVHYLW